MTIDPLEYGKPQGFDTRVEIRHPETGQLIKYQPYTLTVTGGRGGATSQIFERDGKKYWPNGELVQETQAETEALPIQEAFPEVRTTKPGAKKKAADAA